MQLNIALTPIFEYDNKADRYLVFYKEFPQCFAMGKTEDEAEVNLIPILELMWKERPRDLGKVLLENYVTDIHRINPAIVKQ